MHPGSDGIAFGCIGPAVQGKYVPGGTPDADEEKSKEKETLVGRERGPASLALFLSIKEGPSREGPLSFGWAYFGLATASG